MPYVFSPSKNAFFPFSLKAEYLRAGAWPDDAVEVTAEEWQTYGQGRPPAGMRRGADSDGHPAWVEIPAKPVSDRRDRQLDAIDQAAGQARARFASPGQMIDEEYRQALEAVKAWRAAGSPADAIPPEIQSGADYSGITVEEAAVEIEQTAEQWDSVIAQIRNLRLAGKRAVKDAADDQIEAVAQGYLDQLGAIKPPEA
tara:strand:+ start:7658 stop:8254 length:597 start_codon:yes stop_codon:yes gene_type:complete